MQLFNYEGKINFAQTVSLMQRIISRASDWDKSKNHAVVVTLKEAGSFAEPKEIEKLCSDLDQTAEFIGQKVALIDYNKVLYDRLKPYAKGHHVLLLDNKEVASMFLEPEKSSGALSVLVYEPEASLAKELMKQIQNLGHHAYLAKTTQEFQDRRYDKDINLIISKSALNSTETTNKAASTMKLSKKLIANLPLFINTSVETLMSLTELNATKTDHGIGTMHSPISPTPYCAIMEFSGEFSGSFYLIFPKPIASKALAALMGEDEPEEYSKEEILDGVGEFCNIITGSIKRELQAKKLNVTFELPKTYASIQESSKDYNIKQGIWIDMQLADNPFYLFIA